MIHNSGELERKAAMETARKMAAAARTAPKACGVDVTDTLVLDGAEKDALTAEMRRMAEENGRQFFLRDAANIDAAHFLVLIGSSVKPRGLDCALCGAKTCAEADAKGISCAFAVNDLGIAVGSAASVAMDSRIDNRVLFSAGAAAVSLKLFSGDITLCFGIGLAVTGKNIFFDR